MHGQSVALQYIATLLPLLLVGCRCSANKVKCGVILLRQSTPVCPKTPCIYAPSAHAHAIELLTLRPSRYKGAL